MTEDARPDEPLIYSLLALTHTLTTTTEAMISDVLTELDLTHALADALWQLDPAAPEPAMRELAARLHCDPSTITFLADRLEAKGMVTRQVDARNRRVKTLRLTPEGRRTRRRLVEAMAVRSPMANLAREDQLLLQRLLIRALAGDREPASSGGASAP